MSKKEFWAKQIVLDCPDCGKGYKRHSSMMSHFSREHGATRKQQLAMLHKAIDAWAEKCAEHTKETTSQ